MKRLPSDANDDVIVSAIEEWVDLLAAGKIEEATAWLFQPPNAAQPMTAELIDQLIVDYWWDAPPVGDRHRVTARASAAGRGPRTAIVRLTVDPTAGSVDYALPVDGKWSDLTAILEFRRLDDATVISLDHLHVL
ncbi:MAG TPA: hypothetical protein DCF65_10215 [Chloroflexi bacterium]|jgi:hypothetical protein|nr:hypothetical protein [Chloroflexota bacterium]HAF20281.1 hypothetical protein [Chloroflexota bacterium]